MVGAEGASSDQQRGRDLLGPLNTTSILTSESQLTLSDRVCPKLPAPVSTIHRWSTLTIFFCALATKSDVKNIFSNFHLGWHACSDLLWTASRAYVSLYMKLYPEKDCWGEGIRTLTPTSLGVIIGFQKKMYPAENYGSRSLQIKNYWNRISTGGDWAPNVSYFSCKIAATL